MALPQHVAERSNMEDELMGLVLQLSGWVKGVAPDVWNIMMQQVLLRGIENAFGGVVALIVGIYCGRSFRKYLKRRNEEERLAKEIGGYYDEDDYELEMFISAVFIITATITLICTSISATGYLFNPQYYALLEIIQMFH